MNAVAESLEPRSAVDAALATVRARVSDLRAAEAQHRSAVEATAAERQRLAQEQERLAQMRGQNDLAAYRGDELSDTGRILEERLERIVRHISAASLPALELAAESARASIDGARRAVERALCDLHRAEIFELEARADREPFASFSGTMLEILARSETYGDDAHDNDPAHRRRRRAFDNERRDAELTTPINQRWPAPLFAVRARLAERDRELLGSAAPAAVDTMPQPIASKFPRRYPGLILQEQRQ